MEAGIQRVPLELIDRDPGQPRTEFDEEALQQLADSIKENGLLQPVTLRRTDGRFVVIAGERRVRACRMIGWKEIQAIVLDVDQNGFRKLQMIENVVREPLNPVEFAKGLQRMVSEGMTTDEIGKAIGRDSGHISYTLQILNCVEEALHLIAKGQLKVWVGWHLARLSQNGQHRALRTFQLHSFCANEMVSICERIYAQEHQIPLFDDIPLTSAETKVAKVFMVAFTRLSAQFDKLEKLEYKKPGFVASAIGRNAKVVRLQVRELMRKLRWLDKLLRAKDIAGGVDD